MDGTGRTVDGDAYEVAELLELAARQAERAQVPEDEVVVRAGRLELLAARDELRAEGARVGDDLLRVRLPRGLARLEEGSRDTRDGLRKSHVISRTGENKWGSRTLL